MKKETVIAIIFGLGLGGVVAFFLLAKNKEMQLDNTKTIAPVLKISPSIGQPGQQESSLEVIEPNNDAIVTGNTVTIKGKASKGSLLIVQSPVKEVVQKLDSNQFSIPFNLALGENTITLTLYPADKNVLPQEKELKVYYLTE